MSPFDQIRHTNPCPSGLLCSPVKGVSQRRDFPATINNHQTVKKTRWLLGCTVHLHRQLGKYLGSKVRNRIFFEVETPCMCSFAGRERRNRSIRLFSPILHPSPYLQPRASCSTWGVMSGEGLEVQLTKVPVTLEYRGCRIQFQAELLRIDFLQDVVSCS